jgi:23S rRNA (uracil1939-C5)-methyltransferase
MSELFEAVVEKIVQGGDGLVRHKGMAVFLPGVVTNERVLARISSTKKNFARGRVEKVLEPGPSRVDPICSHYGICGGCQLQHLAYEAQLRAKEDFVKEALSRIAQVKEMPAIRCVAAKEVWHYRRHIRLKLWACSGKYKLGFFQARSHEGVAMENCHIFLGHDGPLFFRALDALISQLDMPKDPDGHLSILKNGAGRFILGFEFAVSKPRNIESVLLKAFEEQDLFAGAFVSSGSQKQVFGSVDARFKVRLLAGQEELSFLCRPDAFVQSHATQSETIYNDIVNKLVAVKAHTVLDLYCGIGVLCTLLAKMGLRSFGVEVSSNSIELALQNSKNNNVHVEWTCARAEDVAENLLCRHNADTVILNPPRTGVAPELLQVLVKNKPKHIFYMSCMPPTMARDVKILIQAGYKLKSCDAYDMFPQTTHVETLLHLEAAA